MSSAEWVAPMKCSGSLYQGQKRPPHSAPWYIRPECRTTNNEMVRQEMQGNEGRDQMRWQVSSRLGQTGGWGGHLRGWRGRGCICWHHAGIWRRFGFSLFFTWSPGCLSFFPSFSNCFSYPVSVSTLLTSDATSAVWALLFV